MKYLDANGEPLRQRDKVVLMEAPTELLNGLPASDQEAIKAKVGKLLIVEGFDEIGNAEVEFIDSEGSFHSIWVPTSCVEFRGHNT